MSKTFKYGQVDFPLGATSVNPLLRDADPAVYYTLELLVASLESHLGERLVSEAADVGVTDIQRAVADAIPIDPEQFLTETHIKFPLLTLHREGTTYKYISNKRVAIHRMRCGYVLPPLKASQAERLIPILHAVGLLIDQKLVDGRDDAYTPTLPTGTANEFIWTKGRAGLAKVDVKESTVGAFQVSNELFFPALVCSIEMWETNTVAPNSTYPDFLGADVGIDLAQSGEAPLQDFEDVETGRLPTIASLSPASGSASGGTLVTITGSNFRPDFRPLVLFGGSTADGVLVVDATTITCRTPPFAAYPSTTVDVLVMSAETDHVAKLEAAFTFNNP